MDDPTKPGVAWLQLTVGLRALQLLETYVLRLSYEVRAVVPHRPDGA